MSDQDIWDGDWVLFAHDPTIGKTVWYNPSEDKMRISSVVDGIMASNKVDRQESQGRGWGEGKRVASIPMQIYQETIAPALQQEDYKHISKFLNDGDNAAWRTKEGNV